MQCGEYTMSTELKKMREIGNLDDECPYCSALLEKRPQKKTKCPHCGNFIFVRTRPTDRKRVLVTENQAMEIEDQWDEIHSMPEIRIQKKNGFEQEKEKLTRKFGRAPSDNDVIWSLLNKELIQHASAGHWGLYRNALFEMGEVLRAESKSASALNKYYEVCYLDLNGCNNYGNVTDVEREVLRPILGKEMRSFEPERGELFPGVLDRVEFLINLLDIKLDSARVEFLKVAAKLQHNLRLPISPDSAWERMQKELAR